MPLVHYQENTREHAYRLGVTPHFARTRRRVLAARLEGRAVPSVEPKHLCHTPVTELMATLALKPDQRESHLGTLWLVPSTAPPTPDRLQGQVNHQHQRQRRIRQRAQKRSQGLPPYGYQRTLQKTLVPDPTTCKAIQAAFHHIVDLIAQGRHAPWGRVAADLNATGHARQQGKPWTAETVRALTHEPRYAGYVRVDRRGIGDDVEVDSTISESLVDINIFVIAAHLGHRTTPQWLYALEMLAHEQNRLRPHSRHAVAPI